MNLKKISKIVSIFALFIFISSASFAQNIDFISNGKSIEKVSIEKWDTYVLLTYKNNYSKTVEITFYVQYEDGSNRLVTDTVAGKTTSTVRIIAIIENVRRIKVESVYRT